MVDVINGKAYTNLIVSVQKDLDTGDKLFLVMSDNEVYSNSNSELITIGAIQRFINEL